MTTRNGGTDRTVPTTTTAASNSIGPVDSNDSIQILPLLEPPDAEEALNFYHGLPSKPRLVGRTLAEPNPVHGSSQRMLGASNALPRKHLSSIGDHPVLKCWHDVRPAIIAAINDLEWTSIDVFRIGYSDVPIMNRQVVVWIGIIPKDVGWNTVAWALRSCRKILDAADLADVDCQIRESEVFSLAGPPLLEPCQVDGTTIPLYAQPFTTAIGQSIFPVSQYTLQGALGVYLCLADGAAPPLWALTCRHVGMPSALNLNNAHYIRKNESELVLPIGIPGKEITETVIRELESTKKTITGGLALLPSLDDINNLLQTVKQFWPIMSRIIGSVYLAPPIGLGQGPSCPFQWTRDWCLIELQRDKFPGRLYPTSVVDIRTKDMWPYNIVQMVDRHAKDGRQSFKRPMNGCLTISGVIEMKEILKPMTLNAKGEECFLVGKRGPATGLTWGTPSELLSTVRHRLPGGGTIVSSEWAVQGSLDVRSRPFSAVGDSGAAIFDIDGRLGGLLTRGSGSDRTKDRTKNRIEIDVTYATPAEPLIADIERKLGRKVKLL